MTQEGYTLIEILIVLVVMVFLFAAGYANLRSYSQRQVLISATTSLQSDLRLAEEGAIVGNVPSGCARLNGYQFMVNSSTSYEIDAVCTNNTIIVVKIGSVVSGLTMSSPTPNPVIFKSLAQGTNLPLGTIATITITQSGTGNTASVIINSNGNIQ